MGKRFLWKAALVCAPAFASGLAAAEEVVLSTASGAGAALELSSAPAKARAPSLLESNPWSTTFGYDGRGSRAGIQYRIRWDAGDIPTPKSTAQFLFRNPAPMVKAGIYGMLRGSRLDFYGVRMRPFEDLLYVPKISAAEDGVAVSTAPSSSPRPMRFHSLTPLLDDLRGGAHRELRRFLIQQAFDSGLPDARGAPYWQKEAAMEGLSEVGQKWSADWDDRQSQPAAP